MGRGNSSIENPQGGSIPRIESAFFPHAESILQNSALLLALLARRRSPSKGQSERASLKPRGI